MKTFMKFYFPVSKFFVIFIADVTCQLSPSPNLNTPDEQNVADKCFTPISCPANAKYRTIDGSCNNANKSWWGMSNTPYVRLLKADYKDVENNFRVSVVNGSELPSARLLSNKLLTPKDIPGVNTRLFTSFGQLVAHDVLINPLSNGPNCCSDSGYAVVSTTNGCRPIIIPDDDPFFSTFGRKCQEYREPIKINCSALPTSPLLPNAIGSHYMDASFIYGLSEDESKRLRAGVDGKLAVQNTSTGRQYMLNQPVSQCPVAKTVCYKAADPRANQNLDLAVLQTTWLRLHNFIAIKLAEFNPSWAGNDETLFQEARRFIIAFMQHITYSEWLPHILELELIASQNLAPLTSGYATGYDASTNPSSLADFAGAAFRTLHSYIPAYTTISGSGEPMKVPFSATMFKSGDFLQDGDTFDSDTRDLITAHGLILDRYYTTEITNHLIQPSTPRFNGTFKFGDDLAAMDIQRGRIFGLRSYNAYRELAGLTPFKTFDEIGTAFGSNISAELSATYKSPEDIDYYIGSLLEATALGKAQAKTLQVVWAEQFRRYKFADSFFYEFEGPGQFTAAQLQVIRGFKMAHAICIAADNITSIQLDVFNAPGNGTNEPSDCTTLVQSFLTDLKACLNPSL